MNVRKDGSQTATAGLGNKVLWSQGQKICSTGLCAYRIQIVKNIQCYII